MAEFEVKVPITVKGGREGEKVGKQIGEKIAAQIQKAFKSIGITRPATGGGGMGAEALGIGRMSKSLASIATKVAIISLVAAGTLKFLSKSSPYLKGILSLFGRAFMIFFRPFGDFLATLLRPLAIMLMKMAVAFLKWTRTPAVEKAKEVAVKAIGMQGGFIGGGTIGLAGGLNEMLGPLFDQLKKFPGWIWEKLTGIWFWAYDLGGWLWGNIQTVWNYTEDFGGWIWIQLKTIWNYIGDFGGWLWEQLKIIWNYAKDFGSWLWEKVTSIWSWTWDFGSWLWNKITDALGNIGKFFGLGEGQVGIPNVPHEGIYHLHKGEEVVPRTRVGTGRSVIFRPTFQITGGGITQDIDMDAIVRRAGRMTEMELKKRGIL